MLNKTERNNKIDEYKGQIKNCENNIKFYGKRAKEYSNKMKTINNTDKINKYENLISQCVTKKSEFSKLKKEYKAKLEEVRK